MSNVHEHIMERLDGFYETNYQNVPNCFIFKFGRYISMVPGYEKQVDEISKVNVIMRVMQCVAYILRSIEKLTDKHEIRQFLRETLGQIDSEFPAEKYPEERQALINVIQKELSRTVASISESVVTDVAPVVPYEEKIEKPFESVIGDYLSPDLDVEAELRRLLLENLLDIMETDSIDYSPDELKDLDRIFSTESQSPVVRYNQLATLYYHNSSPELLKKVLDFYRAFDSCDSVVENYSDFEAIISSMAGISTPIMEEWEDMSLEDRDQEVVDSMIAKSTVKPDDREDGAPFDITALYNFIALNRYMQFDTWSNRIFVEKISNYHDEVHEGKPEVSIINVNRLRDNIYAYELTNGCLFVPYMDLRDYRVRYICLKRDSARPFITENIRVE